MTENPQTLLDKGGKLYLSAYFNALYFQDCLKFDDDTQQVISAKYCVRYKLLNLCK